MVNPFKELKQQVEVQQMMEEGWEEVEGAMACQHRGCREVATKGLLHTTKKILTWKCSEEHISSMNNFEA